MLVTGLHISVSSPLCPPAPTDAPTLWSFLLLQAHQALSDFWAVLFLWDAPPSSHPCCFRYSSDVTSSMKAFLTTLGRVKVSLQGHSYVCSTFVQSRD